MKTSMQFATALVGVALTIGSAGIAAASRADDIRVGRPTVTRLDDDEHEHGDRVRCADVPSTPTTAPGTGGAMSQTITVTVERTTLLRVDRRNRIVAAATNTGCRPTRGDRVYVVTPSGAYLEITDVDLDDIEWRGSFRTIAGFERQSGRERLDDH